MKKIFKVLKIGLRCFVRFFHRWVSCTREIHCDVTHFDDKGVAGEWKCNICGDYNPAIVWEKAHE